jgi:methionyl-tRNA synthetase
LVDAANLHIAQSEPWALAKDPSKADQLTQVLFDAADAIRLSAVLLSPVLPRSAAEILKRVGAASDSLNLDRDGQWRPTGERLTVLGTQLWPRFDVKKVKEPSVSSETVEPRTASVDPRAANKELGTDSRISIDDFKKVELRTAKVLAAERVPKSKKLLKLQVDLGTEQRTILAGIAEAYQPEALIGRTIVVVANLAPAKLMGIESNGMVLAASNETGQPVLLSVEAQPGWTVR